ncbi:hypothetical protein Pla123a_44770 [Posidoniimonas polymericola]|uniref:Lipoprotein n=1 Tax=Posidoniimonas polymericola TaxID=2528002 RepID=A0A5C5XWC2_9BACT|nr:hypothetical protein [Posidoniimonas polymericola]TWT66779.1 hypothetical protein Pla123a_44770 [Posidoniimonas polymericola]
MRALLLAAVALSLTWPAHAQTVINVPPDPAPNEANSGETLYLADGGSLPGGFAAHTGSIVSVSGGAVADGFIADEGSVVLVSGGRIGSFQANDGSSVTLAGGSYGDFAFRTSESSSVSFWGGEFRLNGELIPGLDAADTSATIEVPFDAAFSGTLADGTPFAFTTQESGSRLDGVYTLQSLAPPAVGPAVITASTDPVPLGIRAGQTLILDSGATIPDDFNAGWGSTVEIHEGGVVGHNLEATGAVINMAGGQSQGDLEVFYGGVLNMSGGTLTPSNDIFSGGTANLSGGSVPLIYGWADSQINATGAAAVGTVRLLPGASILVDDDADVVRLEAYDIGPRNYQLSFPNGVTSTWRVAGGRVGNQILSLKAGVTLDVSGGEVRAVEAPRDTRLEMSGGSASSVTIGSGGVASLSGGVIGGLVKVNSGGVLHASGGSATSSVEVWGGAKAEISGGQFGPLYAYFNSRVSVSGGEFHGGIFVSSGAAVEIANATIDWQLRADPGSTLTVVDCDISGSADVTGTQISLHGQSIGEAFGGEGTQLRMWRGSLGRNALLSKGSVAELHDVTVADDLYVADSQFHMTGGSIGDRARVDRSDLFLTNSNVGEMFRHTSGTVQVHGGTFGARALFQNIQSGAITGATFAEAAALLGPLTISGSRFGDNLAIEAGSIIVDPGAAIGNSGRVLSGGQAIVTGGTIGNRFIVSASRVSMTSGSISDQLGLYFSSEATVSGGMLGANTLVDRSTLHLIGSDFQLDGVPILGLSPGVRTTLAERNLTLTATLADGTPFDFVLDTSSTGPADRILGSAIVTLTLFEGVLGDYNADGRVDAADYAVWRDSLGQAVTYGEGADHDFSGVVDQGDYYVWRNHFGGALNDAGAPVPEAANLGLAALGGVLAGRRRWRKIC